MIKTIEAWGRRVLAVLLGWLLPTPRRPPDLTSVERILVVRCDPRLGNAVMTLPLIRALNDRFPEAQIDVLTHPRFAGLLARVAEISEILVYRKAALLSSEGPIATPSRLHKRRYDLTVDAANPTDPSLTQAWISRQSGARDLLGAQHPVFDRFYTAASPITVGRHEIRMRMDVLSPLGIMNGELDTTAPLLKGAAAGLSSSGDPKLPPGYVVLNLGARIKSKALPPDDYRTIARWLRARGLRVVLTHGPAERGQVEQITQGVSGIHVAPDTDPVALTRLLYDAAAVITADTGPMHLAVAVGTPTCGLFVSTDPTRYGYPTEPHCALDLREVTLAGEHATLEHWLEDRGL